jgi:membrane associated rhomboid family serine protease
MSFFGQQPLSGIVKHLLIINVLMFAGTYLLLGKEVWGGLDYDYLGRLRLAAFMPGSTNFAGYQVFTHMFMHGDVMHLVFNMLTLFFFGPMVEMVWGERRFLTYYVVCGLGAYALYMGVQYWELQREGIPLDEWNVPMLGASGAIFGLLAAFAFHFPNHTVQLIFPPVALKAKYFVPIMAGLELVYGVQRFSTSVAHFAHLGGALTGFLLIGTWYGFRFRR